MYSRQLKWLQFCTIFGRSGRGTIDDRVESFRGAGSVGCGCSSGAIRELFGCPARGEACFVYHLCRWPRDESTSFFMGKAYTHPIRSLDRPPLSVLVSCVMTLALDVWCKVRLSCTFPVDFCVRCYWCCWPPSDGYCCTYSWNYCYLAVSRWLDSSPLLYGVPIICKALPPPTVLVRGFGTLTLVPLLGCRRFLIVRPKSDYGRPPLDDVCGLMLVDGC